MFDTMKEVQLQVAELACNTCVRRVFAALMSIEGVAAVHIRQPTDQTADWEPAIGTVLVKYSPQYVQPAVLKACINQLGYHVIASIPATN
ncbi:MAG: heavy-metal-associated domain-containing protein [Cyanobacteria bacterium NC_groundwater_1444_Ag_S-0.65um_54_12]|nr:heavy-metal-associated domain-containing protein [Cyanobacteria bacterium NC_groundwater_1444_Ag_S-0.65um_54_12]